MADLNFSAVRQLEFSEQDIANVIAADEASALHHGKTLVEMHLGNFPSEMADSAVLAEFAKLAAVMKRPVSKSYSGLAIQREPDTEEKRDAAVEALRYGYGETARRIRQERADAQGVIIWRPEKQA